MDIKTKLKNRKKGFTLVEMLVVIVIIGILTSVIIFNHARFTTSTLISNMAFEIGQEIRQAQAFGLAVRGLDDVSDNFGEPYGVFINLLDFSVPSPGALWRTKHFQSFADTNVSGIDYICDGNSVSSECACDKSTGDECLNRFTLQKDVVISSLKLVYVSNAGIDTCEGVSAAAVNFKRPNPEAIIRSQDSDPAGNPRNNNNQYHALQIKVSSDNVEEESYRYVIVRNTGQISVQNDPLPYYACN